MLRQIALALSSFWDGIKSLVRARLVAPIALYALAQALYLAIIVNFHLPVLAGVMAPVVRILGGGAAVHYPQLFVAMPAIFNKGSLLIGAILGAYVWGVAVIAIANRFGRASGSPWRDALRRFPHLFLAQLPVVLIVLATFFLTEVALAGADVKGNAKRLMLYGPIPFGILVESIFLFAPIAVVLEGRSAASAIARSFGIWRSNGLAALLIVGLTTLPHIPTYWVLQRSATLVSRFSPETILLVLGGDVFLRLVTNVILVVAATLVLMNVAEREHI